MITYFMQLNVKLLFVLILFGFIMGQTRHAAIQNFSNKNRSYLILDFFNLVGQLLILCSSAALQLSFPEIHL